MAKFGTRIKVNYELLRPEIHKPLRVFRPLMITKRLIQESRDLVGERLISSRHSTNKASSTTTATSQIGATLNKNKNKNNSPRKPSQKIDTTSKRRSLQLIASSTKPATEKSPIQELKEDSVLIDSEYDTKKGQKRRNSINTESEQNSGANSGIELLLKYHQQDKNFLEVYNHGWVDVIVVHFCPLMPMLFVDSIVLKNCEKYKEKDSRNRIGFVFAWYGVGNANTDPKLKDIISTAVHKYNAEIVVTSGCSIGHVNISVYAAGN